MQNAQKKLQNFVQNSILQFASMCDIIVSSKQPHKKIKKRGKQKMKKILNTLKALFNGSALRESIDAGAVNLGGQGRNKYGK